MLVPFPLFDCSVFAGSGVRPGGTLTAVVCCRESMYRTLNVVEDFLGFVLVCTSLHYNSSTLYLLLSSYRVVANKNYRFGFFGFEAYHIMHIRERVR